MNGYADSSTNIRCGTASAAYQSSADVSCCMSSTYEPSPPPVGPDLFPYSRATGTYLDFSGTQNGCPSIRSSNPFFHVDRPALLSDETIHHFGSLLRSDPTEDQEPEVREVGNATAFEMTPFYLDAATCESGSGFCVPVDQSQFAAYGFCCGCRSPAKIRCTAAATYKWMTIRRSPAKQSGIHYKRKLL